VTLSVDRFPVPSVLYSSNLRLTAVSAVDSDNDSIQLTGVHSADASSDNFCLVLSELQACRCTFASIALTRWPCPLCFKASRKFLKQLSDPFSKFFIINSFRSLWSPVSYNYKLVGTLQLKCTKLNDHIFYLPKNVTKQTTNEQMHGQKTVIVNTQLSRDSTFTFTFTYLQQVGDFE